MKEWQDCSFWDYSNKFECTECLRSDRPDERCFVKTWSGCWSPAEHARPPRPIACDILKSFQTCCDICQAQILGNTSIYHCGICENGNFDICGYCRSCGASFLGPAQWWRLADAVQNRPSCAKESRDWWWDKKGGGVDSQAHRYSAAPLSVTPRSGQMTKGRERKEAKPGANQLKGPFLSTGPRPKRYRALLCEDKMN